MSSARMAAAVTLLVGIVIGTTVTLSPTLAIAVFVLAAVVSMPHGALDVAVGPAVLGRSFVPMYLALIVATVLVWSVAPGVALVAFVAMAWWHFGSGDVADLDGPTWLRTAHGIAAGGAVFAAAFTLHLDQLAPVVDQLPGGVAGQVLPIIGLVLAVACSVAMLVALWGHHRARGAWPALELVLIVALAVFADPIIAFSVYFLGLHAARHVSEVRRTTFEAIRWDAVLAASVAPILAGAVIIALGLPSATSLVHVSVIGLSALTTPHLLVTETMRRRARARSGGIGTTGLAPVAHPVERVFS